MGKKFVITMEMVDDVKHANNDNTFEFVGQRGLNRIFEQVANLIEGKYAYAPNWVAKDLMGQIIEGNPGVDAEEVAKARDCSIAENVLEDKFMLKNLNEICERQTGYKLSDNQIASIYTKWANMINDLKNGAVKFAYQKKDGTYREAVGTLNERHIPESERYGSDHEYTFPLVHYYDLNADGWRTFCIFKVLPVSE